MAFACTLFNVYFLAVICLVKEVRQWKYYPVAIQSFFDLISCGLVLFYKTLQDALVRMKDNEDRFYYGGELAKWYRGSVLGRDSVFSFCVQNFVLDIANDYRYTYVNWIFKRGLKDFTEPTSSMRATSIRTIFTTRSLIFDNTCFI